ncbi:MAG: hypothetical protein P8O20_05360 [Bacteroidia bacterium]|nr:hypothetical protein [Bacteroidia bacterium]
MGYGLRYTGYSGKDNEFITAAAEVSEGNLFKPQNEAKLDTLTMDGNVGSINAAIYINYALNDKWNIQFNIDAIGFSFGGKKQGLLWLKLKMHRKVMLKPNLAEQTFC